MKISSARYLSSHNRTEDCPVLNKPEYAFIGRSNVGKSTLINMLTGFGSLARVSSNPGKTQMLNFFSINESWTLVDLPGYGYAARSKDTREGFSRMVQHYLANREGLDCVFLLVDCSIETKKVDIEFAEWLGSNNVAFAIVFTKSDKGKKMEVEANIEAFKKKMLENWEELPKCFVTSSESKLGREELLAFITKVNKKAQ